MLVHDMMTTITTMWAWQQYYYVDNDESTYNDDANIKVESYLEYRLTL